MKSWGLIFVLFLSANIQAAPAIKGIFHLGTPERGAQQVQIETGNLNGKLIMAVVSCRGCPPAVYDYQAEPSQTLNKAIYFNAMGLYIMQYDEESFVVIQPDKKLGDGAFGQIGYANVYSSNASKAKSINAENAKQYAIDLSNQIMNQEVGTISGGSGTYHLAVPQEQLGQIQKTYQIELIEEPQKQIIVLPCERCSKAIYEYLPDESNIIGVDVYRHATSYYLFNFQDGVLIYTFANAGGLGKDNWGKNNHYNLYSTNLNYVRQLLNSEEKQNNIDALMSSYFSTIKTELEKRAEIANQEKVANRQLPKQGLSDNILTREAFAAANTWAQSWKWLETLQSAYFVSNDWNITRHPISGLVTGRNISGVVTMTHPDGRCRFQYVGFRQQYDGSQFVNLYMSGVGPIYDLACENMRR